MTDKCGVWSVGLLLAGLLLTPARGSAAPVSCLDDNCIVSAGTSTLVVDEDGEASVLSVANSNQLYLQFLAVTLGVPSAGNPLQIGQLVDTHPLTSATADEDTDQIVVQFANADLSIAVTYTLTEAPITATVSYTVVVQNLTGNPTDLALLDYVDFDLRDNQLGDTIEFIAPNTILVSGKNASGRAISLSSFDYKDVGECCDGNLFDREVDGNLGGGVGPVGPTDVAGGFQNNIALAPNGAFTISRQLIATAPPRQAVAAPAFSGGGIALAVAALCAVAFATLRRRSLEGYAADIRDVIPSGKTTARRRRIRTNTASYLAALV